ncbi:MAG TPA: hypothetical protein VOA19_14350 [Actinomycetes bacterium]|nr:hypothetical protein [Actinomycetes bacterium]
MQVCLPEVEVCLHDDGSEPMMYDLDLRWPDGRIEALEVTRATSASLRRLLHRLGRQGTIAGTECVVAGWFTLRLRHRRRAMKDASVAERTGTGPFHISPACCRAVAE